MRPRWFVKRTIWVVWLRGDDTVRARAERLGRTRRRTSAGADRSRPRPGPGLARPRARLGGAQPGSLPRGVGRRLGGRAGITRGEQAGRRQADDQRGRRRPLPAWSAAAVG